MLGNHVPAHISQLSNHLGAWAKLKTFPARDKAGQSVIRNVWFHASDNFSCNVVSLVHPCYWHLNVKSRRWTAPDGKPHAGGAAEVAMIQFALNG